MAKYIIIIFWKWIQIKFEIVDYLLTFRLDVEVAEEFFELRFQTTQLLKTFNIHIIIINSLLQLVGWSCIPESLKVRYDR